MCDIELIKDVLNRTQKAPIIKDHTDKMDLYINFISIKYNKLKYCRKKRRNKKQLEGQT